MRLHRCFGRAAVLLAACQSAEVAGVSGARVERRLSAMGTWLELSVRASDRHLALAASERAVLALEACEARLSTWRTDSELARLNRTPVGKPFALSQALTQDLGRVQRLWQATGGAFDPGLGALVAAWGLRTGGRQPADEVLAEVRGAGGFAAFELQGSSAIRRHELAAIEEGGFGKGIGLDAALAELSAARVQQAVLDLGGQFAVLGECEVVLALADPRERTRAVLEVHLGPGSFSTSGNSERGILVGGVPRGHLLDPSSAAPAADFGSLSVWAGDATTADCLSTGLYVMGPERAFNWADEQRACFGRLEVLALIVSAGTLTARATEGWRNRLVPLVSELEIQFTTTPASTTATGMATR